MVNTLYLHELREMLAENNTAELREFCTALHAARTAEFMEGLTPAEAWANLVHQVGSDIRGTQASFQTRDQVVRQLERLRDQQSGVSLDEEAANLIRYQRSYEASARYFTTILDTLDALMAMVR